MTEEREFLLTEEECLEAFLLYLTKAGRLDEWARDGAQCTVTGSVLNTKRGLVTRVTVRRDMPPDA